MKKRPTPRTAESSAPVQGGPIISIGRFPARHSTVSAEVLARLLAGERLDGLNAVRTCSTTRLAGYVHYLESRYGWHIKRVDKVAGCKDGRIAWVVEYWLDADVIVQAMVAGGQLWRKEVCSARLKQRTQAEFARRVAKRINAARTRCSQLGQGGLFDGEQAQ